MKKNIKKSLSMLLALITILNIFSLTAKAETIAPDINSEYAIVYNMDYDTVLYSKNSDMTINPASFTKIMSAILVFEYMQENNTENIKIEASETAINRVSGTNINIKIGEIIPFIDLVYAFVVHSANDAILVLAEYIAGSIDKFVENMNEKAKELNLTDTYFSNPTGIHSGLMQTTINDVLKICLYAYKINNYMQMASLLTHTIAATNMSDERILTSKNLLLNPSSEIGYYIEGVIGINSGSTPEAGYCLATTLEKNGMTNFVILSGAGVVGKTYQSFVDAKKLLTYAFDNYALFTVLDKGKIFTEIKVNMASNVDHCILISNNSFEALLPLDTNIRSDIFLKCVLFNEETTAPVSQNDVFGKIYIYHNTNLLGSVDLVAKNNVTRSKFLYGLNRISSFFKLRWVRIIIIVLLILFIAYLGLLIALILIRNKKMKELSLSIANKDASKRSKSADERPHLDE